MSFYTVKKDVSGAKKIVADDMILTNNLPTCAGSKMLEGFMSLVGSQALQNLVEAGYELCGKAKVGEFSIDLLGESAYDGALVSDGKIVNATAQIVKEEKIPAIALDVNGSVRRAAAQSGLVSIKPTYGTVSRYGTIPAACSGETVSVMANTAGECIEILDIIAGHDDKDGTSLPEEKCALLKKDAPASPTSRIAVIGGMCDGADSDVMAKLSLAKDAFANNGIEVCDVTDDIICASRPAWNILMSAELCNNVSRYDGVKYGYRAEKFSGIDELYTNSRTEAFGELLKTAILFGSDTLSTENYMKVYDKALRVRRLVVEAFAKIFEGYDAVIIPACSAMSYTEDAVKADKYMAFTENYYTAPASITGLPAVVAGGVQIIGKAFSDKSLLSIAALLEKEVG